MLTARQQEICGEIVMHARGSIFCPECGFRVETDKASANRLELGAQVG